MPTDKNYLYVSPTFKYLPATCWLWLFAMSWQGRWWELMSSELPMVRATETQQCGSIKQWDEKCKEVQSTLLILRGATEFMSNLHCFYIRASPRLMSVLISCGFGKQFTCDVFTSTSKDCFAGADVVYCLLVFFPEYLVHIHVSTLMTCNYSAPIAK